MGLQEKTRPILKLKKKVKPPNFVIKNNSDLRGLSIWIKTKAFPRYIKFLDRQQNRVFGLKGTLDQDIGVIILKDPSIEIQAEQIIWMARSQ